MKTLPNALLLLLFLLCGLLKAQTGLSGHVVDVSHCPIPGASVLLFHARTGQLIQTGYTDKYGRFGIAADKSEVYYMAIQAAGYESFCLEPIVPVVEPATKDLGQFYLRSATPPQKRVNKTSSQDNARKACFFR